MNPSVLCFRKIPVAKKFLDKGGGVSNFCVESFLSHSAERFRKEPLSLSLFSAVGKVWMRGWGGGGVSKFSVENFFSHSAEKFRTANF